jgi:imidazolonepropionase-like amidohydrolase
MHMHAVRAPAAFDGTRFLEGGATVLIEADRIVGVEAFGCDLPEGCALATYDGTVLPGLFDAHTHLVSDGSLGALEAAGSASDESLDATIADSLRAQVRAGVTTVRDLGDRNYRTLVARDAGSPGLPRIVAAGPPLTVPAGHCHFLGGEVATPDDIRVSIEEHRDRGVDVIKVMASGGMLTLGTDILGVQFDPEQLRLVVDLAHEAGLQVLAHAHSLAGIEHALTAGVDGIEHFTGLADGGIALDDDVLSRTAEAGVVVDPTYGFDRVAFDSMPTPPVNILEAMRRSGLDVDTFLAARLQAGARIRKHGIRVIAGLDSGAAPTKRHGRMDLVFADFIRAGYSPAETLTAATSAAAEACGLAEVTGSLRTGLAADVLVVDGDLSAGLEPIGVPVQVLARGVQY